MEKIRVFTAFSGYDSQCLSLDRLKKKYPEFDYELVGWSEIDKYAIQAHNAIYPQWADRNYGDISNINWDEVPDFDLFTYSSPCQDFSNAGLQKGGEEGSGTRSSLLWECRRAIVAKKPKFLLMENVAALVSQKFIKTFNKWQEELARYGYTNFAQVLNAKDYGIPQNRERIFLVSVLGEAWYNFPQPFKLEKRLKDVLETNVDEKYYLSEKMIDYFNRVNEDKTHGHNFIKEVGKLSSSQNSRVIDPDGISQAMANGEKDGAPKIVEQCDNLFVANITHVRHFAPNMSSGTGYSEYDILDVYYSNGECEQVKIYTWYESKENIIKDFLIVLRYRITPTDKVISLLFEALRGYVPNEYLEQCDTSVQKDNLVVEPQVMTPKRTEFGKSVRKEYEKGELDISRHAMTELTPRKDGISNTLTSVQKDNLVCEPLFIPEATAKRYAEATDGDSVNLEQPNSKTRRGRVGKQMANTLTTSCNQGVVVSEPAKDTATTICLNSKVNGKQPSLEHRIYDSSGISTAITTGFHPSIVEPLNPYKDGTCRTIKAQYQQSSRAKFARQDGLGATGVVQIGNIVDDTNIGFKNPQRGRVYSADGLSPCLYCYEGGNLEPKVMEEKQPRYRIRKLTPRECFRLMDVDENVIDTIQAAGISNSKQYKLAGNSIVVACLEKIFEQMFFPQYTNSKTLFG